MSYFLAKIYLVVTIQIGLEFAKMDQSTNENELTRSLSTNFGMVRMRTTAIFQTIAALQEAVYNSRDNDRQSVSLLHIYSVTDSCR